MVRARNSESVIDRPMTTTITTPSQKRSARTLRITSRALSVRNKVSVESAARGVAALNTGVRSGA